MAAPRLSKGRHGLLVKLEKIWPSIWLTVCPHPLKSGVRNRDFCKLETRDRRPKGKPPPPPNRKRQGNVWLSKRPDPTLSDFR